MTGPVPGGKAVWYQKHMTHHMLPDFGRDWIEGSINAFLIRAPEAVLASYARKRRRPVRVSTRSACPPSSPCSSAPPTGSAAPRR